jgi:hypothetical protein
MVNKKLSEVEEATNNRLKFIKKEMREESERTCIRVVREFQDVPGLIGDGFKFATMSQWVNTFYKETEYQVKDLNKK